LPRASTSGFGRPGATPTSVSSASLPGARFFIVRAGKRTIGYAIVNEKGRVGPAGVTDPRYSAGLAWAIKEVARGLKAKELFVVVPGTNAGALTAFFESGLQTEFYGAWMSAKPVGSFDGYLLAGGMLSSPAFSPFGRV
jgi:hypothetical protein